MKLHSFAVILGVMIFGEVGGMPAIFLSVPIMAGLKIVWKNWRLRGDRIEAEATSVPDSSPGGPS